MFKAVVISNTENKYLTEYQEISESDLPAGDITIDVEYSSINYKDALAITGRSPVVRNFPMVPGIDLVGTVSGCTNNAFKKGDAVLLTGWGVGERHWGGLAQKARVNSEWLMPLPEGSTSHQVMSIGTAGFTAMLCVDALIKHGISPADGPVLVTGASGGVGSYAIIILKSLGYDIIASTGQAEKNVSFLTKLGADEIITRVQLATPGKPLQKERWAAAIDTVGSHTLVNVCAGTKYGGAVAACGMAQGLDMIGSVAPFILRGITLHGIDSVMAGRSQRSDIWRKVCRYLTADKLAGLTTTLPLSTAIEAAHLLLEGNAKGRMVIDCRQVIDLNT